MSGPPERRAARLPGPSTPSPAGPACPRMMGSFAKGLCWSWSTWWYRTARRSLLTRRQCAPTKRTSN